MPSFRQRTKLGILPWVGGRQPWQQSTARNYAVRRGASHSLAATHTKPAADEGKQTAEPTAADAHPAQAADHASERLMTNGAWPTRDNGSAGIAGVEQNGSRGAMAVAEPWCQRQPVVAMKATVPATR